MHDYTLCQRIYLVARPRLQVLSPTEKLHRHPDIIENCQYIQGAIAYFGDVEGGRDPGFGSRYTAWLREWAWRYGIVLVGS